MQVGALFRVKMPAAPLLHFASKFSHGLRRNGTTFSPCHRSFRRIESGQNFCSSAFTFFPQYECFLDSIFGTAEPAGLDGLTDKGFPVWGQTYIHKVKGRSAANECQAQYSLLATAKRVV